MLIVIGIVTRAPLSKPTTVNVAASWVLEPNNVFIVVALKLIWEPITVVETFVPNVVVDEFAFCAAVVLIPTPVMYSLI